MWCPNGFPLLISSSMSRSLSSMNPCAGSTRQHHLTSRQQLRKKNRPPLQDRLASKRGDMAEETQADQPIAARIAWVRDDRAHGASALAREAAAILRDCALAGLTSDTDADAALHGLHQAARDLASSRPSMIALANTVGRIWAAAQETRERLQTQPPSSTARAALEAARKTADALLS